LGRPSKPIISKERAARAALEVIDEEGIEGLNLALVARRLGVKAPSLYYHFHNKAELLAEVARLILLDASISEPVSDVDWKETLMRLSVSVRRSLLRHPNAAQLTLQFFPRHLLLASYEHWIPKYNIAPELQMLVVEGVEKLTFGSALFAATSRARGIKPMPKFDPKKLPHLASAIRANSLSEEATFIAVLRRFLSAF